MIFEIIACIFLCLPLPFPTLFAWTVGPLLRSKPLLRLAVFIILCPVAMAAPIQIGWNAQNITAALVTSLLGFISIGRAKQLPSDLYNLRKRGWDTKRDLFVSGFKIIPGATNAVLPSTQTGVFNFAIPDDTNVDWARYLANSDADRVGFLDQLVGIMVNVNSFGGAGSRTYFKTDMEVTGAAPTGRVYFVFPTGMNNQEFYYGIRDQYMRNINGMLTIAGAWKEGAVHRIGRLLISWGMPKDKQVVIKTAAGVDETRYMLEFAWPGGSMGGHGALVNNEAMAKVERDLDKIVKAMGDQKTTNKTGAGAKKALAKVTGLEFFVY